MADAVRVLTAPATVILDEWFESEELKATLATDAVIGAMAAPSSPGTGYVLFHHVMGETIKDATNLVLGLLYITLGSSACKI